MDQHNVTLAIYGRIKKEIDDKFMHLKTAFAGAAVEYENGKENIISSFHDEFALVYPLLFETLRDYSKKVLNGNHATQRQKDLAKKCVDFVNYIALDSGFDSPDLQKLRK